MPDALPLAGLRVLDLTRARAGPTAVRQLADWGADALMIEPPVALDRSDNMSGPRHGPDYQNLHRNKRSMTLNLKAPEGIAILRRMAAGADVLVENYRPDVKRRLGIDYKSLAKINPKDATTQLSLATAATDANDTTTAIAAYKAFLKLAPNDSQAPTARKTLKQLESQQSATIGSGGVHKVTIP